ncbi:MAG: hypothetical protein ACRD2L_24100 [Terriglobia bacterium]
MNNPRRVRPEDITLRVERNQPVADVRGGEEYVDARVADAAEKKRVEKVWDSGKDSLREIAAEATDILEELGKTPKVVNLLGADSNLIEVAASSRRKALPPTLAQDVAAAGLENLLVEDVSITLTGELAAWALSTLGDRSHDPNFSMKRQVQLSQSFEATRSHLRKAQQHTSLMIALAHAGIFAPAVEAKVRKG